MAAAKNDTAELRVIHRAEVERMTGLGRSNLYVRVAEGRFPQRSESVRGASDGSPMRWPPGCMRASPNATPRVRRAARPRPPIRRQRDACSSETKKAARRTPSGSPRKFDHVWQAIKSELSRETAAEQLAAIAITSQSVTSDAEPLLPRVAERREADRLARIDLGLPLVDHDALRRRGFPAAMARDEFGEAERRGRGRATR